MYTATPAPISTATIHVINPTSTFVPVIAKQTSTPVIIRTPTKKPSLPGMVFIQGGTYDMGDTFGEGESDEIQHKTTVSSFYMGQYEVTFDEYDRFCQDTGKTKPSDYSWGRDQGQ